MKVHARTAAIWLLMQFSMNGCGLGTEVGNGVKPKNDEEGSKKTQASESVQANQEDADTSASSDEKMEVPTANGAEQSEKGVYDFDVNILLNDCGSPFESTYNGQIALTGLNAAGLSITVSGDFDIDNGSWVIKDTFGKFLATVKDDVAADDYKVAAVDIDNVTIETGYVCAQQAGSATNDMYTYNFELTKNGKTSLLSWQVDATEANEKLISISIKPDTAQKTIIKLETK